MGLRAYVLLGLFSLEYCYFNTYNLIVIILVSRREK